MKNYYGCAAQIKQDDPRQPIWAAEREARGFDDTETWSLDITMAMFFLPRLKRLAEINNREYLKEMIEGFEELVKRKSPFFKFNKEKADRALELFKQHYYDLWW